MKSTQLGAGEMAQQLRACTAPVEDVCSVPSIHIRWLRTTCNASSRGSDVSGLRKHLHPSAQSHRET